MRRWSVHPALLLIWALAVFTFSAHILQLTRQSSSLLGTTSVGVETSLSRPTPFVHDSSPVAAKGKTRASKRSKAAVPDGEPIIRERENGCETFPTSGKSGDKSSSDDYWRNLVLTMARLPARDVIEELEGKDPFGVRDFDRRLKELQSEKKTKGMGSVTLEDIQGLFPCPKPPSCQLAKILDTASLPVPTMFRARQERIRGGSTEGAGPVTSTRDTNHTWILFQHLRKAGGTHFCSVAMNHAHPTNLTRSTKCSPDGLFGRRILNEGSKATTGSLGRFTNEQLVEGMSSGGGGYAVAGNEWDKFEGRFLELPAVFVTSFRDPVSRAFSQYLMECVTLGGVTKDSSGPCVDRGGGGAEEGGIAHPNGGGRSAKNVVQWWRGRNDLYNNYARTFAPETSFRHAEYQKIFSSSPLRVKNGMADTAALRAELVGGAYDVLQQFHLVTVMDWLEYARPMLKDVLGWDLADDDDGKDELTGVVRPFNEVSSENATVQQFKQAVRAEAARIRSDPKLYEPIREFLALDMILNDAVRRMFLERLVCNGHTR